VISITLSLQDQTHEMIRLDWLGASKEGGLMLSSHPFEVSSQTPSSSPPSLVPTLHTMAPQMVSSGLIIRVAASAQRS
jgi:hypothetical protein